MHEDNNITTQMRKGIIEYSFLLILSRCKAYPSELIKMLSRAGLELKEATVYTILNRLRKEGKVDYEWVESPKGPPRKYFFITPTGLEAEQICAATWEQLSGAINYISTIDKKSNPEK